jgi:primosomal protein N'
MQKYKIIETCLKCGYKWIRQVKKPKQCPDCKSTVWHCFNGKRRSFISKEINILPGQSMLYNFDKSTMRMIKAAQRKNPRLIAQARADGVLVSNPLL